MYIMSTRGGFPTCPCGPFTPTPAPTQNHPSNPYMLGSHAFLGKVWDYSRRSLAFQSPTQNNCKRAQTPYLVMIHHKNSSWLLPCVYAYINSIV